VSTERHGRPTATIPTRWVFEASTQWQSSCANDAVFVWLMCDHTRRYTIDEICTDNRKKLAVCVNRASWLAYCDHSIGEFLWSPHNDEILVQRMLFSFGSCVIILPHILDMRSVLRAERNWPCVLTASWSACCNHSRGEFLWSPCNNKILIQMMLFSFGPCVIVLPDIL
jgi:hypothetical protein